MHLIHLALTLGTFFFANVWATPLLDRLASGWEGNVIISSSGPVRVVDQAERYQILNETKLVLKNAYNAWKLNVSPKFRDLTEIPLYKSRTGEDDVVVYSFRLWFRAPYAKPFSIKVPIVDEKLFKRLGTKEIVEFHGEILRRGTFFISTLYTMEGDTTKGDMEKGRTETVKSKNRNTEKQVLYFEPLKLAEKPGGTPFIPAGSTDYKKWQKFWGFEAESSDSGSTQAVQPIQNNQNQGKWWKPWGQRELKSEDNQRNNWRKYLGLKSQVK